jgi:hypothetical protein
VGGSENAANGGAEVVSYDLEWSVDPAFAADQYDAGTTDVPGITAYTARNLTSATRYYVRVAARNVMGFSAFCTETGGLCNGANQTSAVSGGPSS